MKRSVGFGALVLAGLMWSSTPMQAQDCPGDCDGNEEVAINELVTCVNIALGSVPVSTCSPCDVDGDGMVSINELIQAVNAALCGCEGCVPTPTPTPGEGFCGDGSVNVEGEECDDGNNFGGDDCAANCTEEIRRMTMLDPAKSLSSVQILGFLINVTVTGNQVLTAGTPRDNPVIGPNDEQLFAEGEFPLTLKMADVAFDPVRVGGIACACVRALEVEEFGPGISGIGLVGCGDQGLSDVNYTIKYDHNTKPGDPSNSGSAAGLPDDPECDDHTDAGSGVTADACLEAPQAECNPTNTHVGICNAPRQLTFSGGPGGRGSVLLTTRTAIGLLSNATDPNDPCHPTCAAEDFGPDCLPCTDDDLDLGRPNVGVTTSGTVNVELYDANNVRGFTIAPGQQCGASPCVASVTGERADCDALEEDPNGPLQGALVTGFVGYDSDIGDSVTTTTLAAQQ